MHGQNHIKFVNKMWQEAIVEVLTALSQHSLEGLKKNTEMFGHGR